MSKHNDPQQSDAPAEPTFRLDQEIARKYDASQLSKLIMRDAGRGEALDLHTRGQMERRLGGDFSQVRLFRGPLAEEVTARYRADAVTVGGTEMILVREGWRSNFQTAAGQALLAHELTHIGQQQRGLHFAHTHGGHDAGHEALEEEAEAVEAATLADHQGQSMAHESEARRTMAERNIWDEVRLKVKEMKEKGEDNDDERGNQNQGSGWGQNRG
jgi:hypothetical protein